MALESLLLLTLFVPLNVHSSDVTLSGCGAGNWYNGQQITLTCTVLRTHYSSGCVTPSNDDGKAQFRQKAASRCTITDVAAACSLSNVGTEPCRCISQNANQYVLEYKFTAGNSDNGTWDCNVPCFNMATPVLSYSGENCQNKFVTESSGDQHVSSTFLMVINLIPFFYWASTSLT